MNPWELPVDERIAAAQTRILAIIAQWKRRG